MPQNYFGEFTLGSQDPLVANIWSVQMLPFLRSEGPGLVGKMFSFTVNLLLIFRTAFPLKHLAVLSLCRSSAPLHSVSFL